MNEACVSPIQTKILQMHGVSQRKCIADPNEDYADEQSIVDAATPDAAPDEDYADEHMIIADPNEDYADEQSIMQRPTLRLRMP
jgi:hypothetical protein